MFRTFVTRADFRCSTFSEHAGNLYESASDINYFLVMQSVFDKASINIVRISVLLKEIVTMPSSPFAATAGEIHIQDVFAPKVVNKRERAQVNKHQSLDTTRVYGRKESSRVFSRHRHQTALSAFPVQKSKFAKAAPVAGLSRRQESRRNTMAEPSRPDGGSGELVSSMPGSPFLSSRTLTCDQSGHTEAVCLRCSAR